MQHYGMPDHSHPFFHDHRPKSTSMVTIDTSSLIYWSASLSSYSLDRTSLYDRAKASGLLAVGYDGCNNKSFLIRATRCIHVVLIFIRPDHWTLLAVVTNLVFLSTGKARAYCLSSPSSTNLRVSIKPLSLIGLVLALFARGSLPSRLFAF